MYVWTIPSLLSKIVDREIYKNFWISCQMLARKRLNLCLVSGSQKKFLQPKFHPTMSTIHLSYFTNYYQILAMEMLRSSFLALLVSQPQNCKSRQRDSKVDRWTKNCKHFLNEVDTQTKKCSHILNKVDTRTKNCKHLDVGQRFRNYNIDPYLNKDKQSLL